MSYLNADQLAYLKELSLIDPNDRCWCGWSLLGQCQNCLDSIEFRGFTLADRLKGTCSDCGNTARKPNLPIIHLVNCPERAKQ